VKVVVRVAIVLLTVTVLERGLASQLRIDGAAADLLLLMAISGGMVGGPDDGAIVGFFAGLSLDLLVQTPLGLGALVYCITGYLVGLAQSAVVRSSRLQPVFLAAAASVFGVGLYVLVSLVVGRSGLINQHLLVVIAVVAGANAVLIPVANRAMRWALGDSSNVRAAVR
jgi:rod shape-determining protein MreD